MLASDSVRTVLVETTLLDHTVEMTRTIDDLLRGYGYRSHRARRNGVPDPINVMEHLGLREDILWTRTER